MTSWSVPLQAVESRQSTVAVVSLPSPPGYVDVSIDAADHVQAVPLGQWSTRIINNPRYRNLWPTEMVGSVDPLNPPPQRHLLFASRTGGFGERIDCTVAAQLTGHNITAPACGAADIAPGEEIYQLKQPDKEQYHYLKREDRACIDLAGHTLCLELGFEHNYGCGWWQYIQVEPLWQGPVCCAYQFGGHIYVGEDRPMTIAEVIQMRDEGIASNRFVKGTVIVAKAFVQLFDNGCVMIDTHFINNDHHSDGGALVPGRPVVRLTGDHTLFLRAFVPTSPAGVYQVDDDGRHMLWRPLDDTSVYLGNIPRKDATEYKDDQPDYDRCQYDPMIVHDSPRGFVAGVARSFSCAVMLSCDAALPIRYLPSPQWYRRCGVLGVPVACTGDTDKLSRDLQQVAQAAIGVFTRNQHDNGMTRGGVFRYLDQPDARRELSFDGNETAQLFRGAWGNGHTGLYTMAVDNARFIADVGVNHQSFNVRLHHVTTDWGMYSMIYQRFGGLVYLWQETGDPWYRHLAEACANRWLAVNEEHQPRHNIGRDAEAAEGLSLLWEATGLDYWYQAACRVARQVARSIEPDGSWRSGVGVGPAGGVGAMKGIAWNGSHMLAALSEVLARVHPATSGDYEYLAQRAALCLAAWLDDNEQHITDGSGGHRAACSFLPRRIYMLAALSGDKELINRVLMHITAIVRQCMDKGESFFTAGHHCAGYLDIPLLHMPGLDDAD